MRLLDLFAGAGGAAEGYARAGFEVVGVDINPQPHYPFEFHQADALKFSLDGFDMIHASPPCQPFSRANRLRDAQGSKPADLAIDLLMPVRRRLLRSGKPYIIENVPGAPMLDPVMLCGSMFDLAAGRRQLRRHRLFESNIALVPPGPCRHAGKPLGVYHRMNDRIPHGGHTARTLKEGQRLMGINWMTWDELKEAIPPAYTLWLGIQAIEEIS